MAKRAGQWVTDRLNRQRFAGEATNDDAFDAQERAAQRRKNLRMVEALVPLVDHEAAIESAWDEERNQREDYR